MKKIDKLIENVVNEEVERINILGKNTVLNEASFARVVTTYFDTGFIVITADRSCEAETGRKCSEEEEKQQSLKNKENEKKIEKMIRSAGFGYLPTYGGFKEKVVDKDGNEKLVDSPNVEKSFIVPSIRVASYKKRNDYESLKNLGTQLATEFNQDSFLYKPPSEVDTNAYYIDKTGKVDMTFKDVTANDLGQIYFTQMRKMNPNRRFTMIERIYLIPKPPNSTSEARNRYGEFFHRFEEGANK